MSRLPLEDICRKAGVPYKATAGWSGRGSSSFYPTGLMHHHTAGPSSGEIPELGILINGRAGLSGPLCNVGVGRSGTIYLVASGRANHAGRGMGSALTRTRNDVPPPGDVASSNGSTSGNAYYVGLEYSNSGRQPLTAGQKKYGAMFAAEFSRRYGWTANRNIHHRQWTRRKPDIGERWDVIRATNIAIAGGGGMPPEEDELLEIAMSVASEFSEVAFHNSRFKTDEMSTLQLDPNGIIRQVSWVNGKGWIEGSFGPPTGHPGFDLCASWVFNQDTPGEELHVAGLWRPSRGFVPHWVYNPAPHAWVYQPLHPGRMAKK